MKKFKVTGMNCAACSSRVEKAVSKLDGLSPLNTLKRGFSVARSENGSVIKSVGDVNTGSEISVVVSDGEIAAVVK